MKSWSKVLIPPLIAAGSFVGCTDSGQPPPKVSERSSTKIPDILADYRNFTKMTPAPVPVDKVLFSLCRLPRKQDIDSLRARYGPHANTTITIYMNDLAKAAYEKKSMPYPTGSVIVKDKLLFPTADERGHVADSATHAGFGAMVKREPGFDPEHGDWEYFYHEEGSELEQGKISSCIQCHLAAKGTDHVFGSWSLPERSW